MIVSYMTYISNFKSAAHPSFQVSASANNSICAVGVAFKSRIGGVRMLDGDVTDAVEVSYM